MKVSLALLALLAPPLDAAPLPIPTCSHVAVSILRPSYRCAFGGLVFEQFRFAGSTSSLELDWAQTGRALTLQYFTPAPIFVGVNSTPWSFVGASAFYGLSYAVVGAFRTAQADLGALHFVSWTNGGLRGNGFAYAAADATQALTQSGRRTHVAIAATALAKAAYGGSAAAGVTGSWSTTFTVTPEPSTILLVATGLAALLLVGRARRTVR